MPIRMTPPHLRFPSIAPAPRVWLAAAALALAVRPAAAQDPADSAAVAIAAETVQPGGGRLAEEAVVVGSEAETYLRVLQVAGEVPAYPWSSRAFSPREVERMLPEAAHPWTAHLGGRAGERTRGAGLLRPAARVTYNSAFPYGFNDGAAWVGRGVTAELRAGVRARWGALSLHLEPVVFWAQNQEFDLLANGDSAGLVYADGVAPRAIDLPQRFGPDSYARVDPGESTLRVDAGGVAMGVSTASLHWGPASDHPIILGNNAGGFPHAFLGTAAPVNVGIGRLHGRVVWGALQQSEWSSVEGHGSRRYATGLVAVFTPRGVPGLELGGTRFFHVAWPAGGLEAGDLLKTFEGITKASLDSTGIGPDGRGSLDNQLASVFVRWLLPSAGLEVYGEFGREDHNWDLLDLALEPDHTSGYLLGFRKAWSRGPRRLVSLRAEVLNTQRSHLVHARLQQQFYAHSFARQGHTQRGQALGSAFGFGGGASVLGVDVYRPWGRWSVAWMRGRVGDRSEYWRTGTRDDDMTDVVHSLSADALLFSGGVELTAGATASTELNRHFAGDAFNLNLRLGVRLGR
jgi:hypothetical protein